MSENAVLDPEAPLLVRRVARARVLTTCHLAPEQHEGLRTLAEREMVSQAALIRRAVGRLLQEAGL